MDSVTTVIAIGFFITMLAIFALVHYVRLRIGQQRERSPRVGHGRRRAAYGSNPNPGKYSGSGYYGADSYSGSDSSGSSGGCDSGSSSCD